MALPAELTQHIHDENPAGHGEQSSLLVQRAPVLTRDQLSSGVWSRHGTHLALASVSNPTTRKPGRRTPMIESSSPRPASSFGVALTWCAYSQDRLLRMVRAAKAVQHTKMTRFRSPSYSFIELQMT